MADLWLHAHPLVLIGVAVAATILAIVVTTALGGRAGTAPGEGADSPRVNAGQAATRPGPPPGCSNITMTPGHAGATIEEFDRRVWCERYHATPNNSSIYQFVGVP